MSDEVAEHFNGYKHLFLIADFWTSVFRSPFYNWYSKNWNTDSVRNIRQFWGVPAKHLCRESGFKGTKDLPEDEPKILSIPFAAATGAGVICLLGILGQHRGLANQSQEGAVKALGRMTSCIRSTSFVLRILPDWSVKVIDLMVQMDQFWSYYAEQHQKALKQRILGLYFNNKFLVKGRDCVDIFKINQC